MTKVSIEKNKKKLLTCNICGGVLSDCIVVSDEKGRGCHPNCIYPAEEYHRDKAKQKEKEKELAPYLFAKVERLEKEIMEMKNGSRKSKKI